jgi:hypothetical protein
MSRPDIRADRRPNTAVTPEDPTPRHRDPETERPAPAPARPAPRIEHEPEPDAGNIMPAKDQPGTI